MFKVLTFKVGKEDYCVKLEDILTVENITEIHKLPKASSFVLGVTSLRNEIINVVSLKGLMNQEENINAITKMIVLNTEINVALAVDDTYEIIDVIEEDLADVREILHSEYTDTVVKYKDCLLVLLNTIELIKKMKELELQ